MVLDGLVRKFGQIWKICENTFENLNILAFNYILLSFLGFVKLRVPRVHTRILVYICACQYLGVRGVLLSLFRL
jgi:hypothetical protein